MADEREESGPGEAVTTKHVGLVLAAFAAFQVIVGVGANWFFYTRSDGRVLEERMNSMRDSQKDVSSILRTVTDTVTALQFQQGKQVEAMNALAESLREVVKEQQDAFRERVELRARITAPK